MIELKNVSKIYKSKKSTNTLALKDISINITKTKDTDNPKTLKILISEYSELNEDEQTAAQEADKNELTALLTSYGLTSDQFSF